MQFVDAGVGGRRRKGQTCPVLHEDKSLRLLIGGILQFQVSAHHSFLDRRMVNPEIS